MMLTLRRKCTYLIAAVCTVTIIVMYALTSVQQDETKRLSRYKELVLWNSDHHPAPASDVRNLLEPLGIRFLHTDLSPYRYCRHFNTCENRKKLKVINSQNMFYLDHSLIPKFYAAYANDPQMQSVDAFLCIDPPAICELYEPFNKTMIIIASNRYHVGRQSKETWTKWNSNLRRYAADPRTIIGANNLYDVNFLRYFTGIEATFIPSYTGYTGATYCYNGTRNEFLLANRRSNPSFLDSFVTDFINSSVKMTSNARNFAAGVPQLVKISAKYYGGYKHRDLTQHPGIVHLPYQISTMSISEHYRMNIPLFFPSRELTLRLDVEKNFLTDMVSTPKSTTPLAHPFQIGIPYPLDKGWNATRYWIQFADFYRLPYITYFDSVDHLVSILSRLTHADLWTISRKMAVFNAAEKKDILRKWKFVMDKVAKYSRK